MLPEGFHAKLLQLDALPDDNEKSCAARPHSFFNVCLIPKRRDVATFTSAHQLFFYYYQKHTN